MKKAIEGLEKYVNNEDKCIKFMEEFDKLPYVTTTPRGDAQLTNRIIKNCRYKDELILFKKMKQCNCSKLRKFINAMTTDIVVVYDLRSPEIDDIHFKIYKCKKCNGYYSK